MLKGDIINALIAKFPEGLRGEAPLAEARLIAKASATNIELVESHHASFRRRLKARIVQTKGIGFEELAAEWRCD